MRDLLLDHVGVGVTDLDLGRDAYERLGFTLTPRGQHEGRATGNHCAMLREGYLEIIGITKPEIASSFHDMVGRYEGAHIVAFGCENAAQALPILQSRHRGVEYMQLLERDAAFGPDGKETRRAAFNNIYVDESVFPEARYIFIEHLTPEVTWQTHLLDHPNGAIGLAEVAICAQDVAQTSARLSSVLAVPADKKGEGFSALDLSRGRVYVLSSEMVPKWAKGVNPPAVPSVVGIGFKVADLEATKAYLDGQDVSYHAHPYPAIWLEPHYGRGTVVSFIQA
ncbi:MAG: hypothetical protein ACI9W2_000113 [Gammaproteobacteria bacterium]|jgi:hypothetical protein